MSWIRSVALYSLIVALLAGGTLAAFALREKRSAAQCAERGQLLDYGSMSCVAVAHVPAERFAVRHTWLVGLMTIATFTTSTFGFWYYGFYRLPLISVERSQRKRKRKGAGRR